MSKTKVKKLPPRSRVKPADTWDLAGLYPGDEAWEKDFEKGQRLIPKYAEYQGKLGESATTLAACLAFDAKCDRMFDRLGNYAFLRTSEDQTNTDAQARISRYQNLVTKAAQAASYIQPEIMGISATKMKKLLAAPELEPYSLQLERMLR